MSIKRVLKEEVNKIVVDRALNLIKDDITYNPMEGLKIDLGIGGVLPTLTNKGNNVALKPNGLIRSYIKGIGVDHFGMNDEESELFWDKVRHYIKKIRFIEQISWVLYEDWVVFQEDPYNLTIPDEVNYEELKFNLKNLDEFIDFMKFTGLGMREYDPHSDETVPILPMLTRDDFEYIRSILFEMIEDENSPYHLMESNNSHKPSINESDDENVSLGDANLFSEGQYEKIFRLFNRDPENIFDIVIQLQMQGDDNYSSTDKEFNLIYKYLTQYKDRVPHYIKINLDSNDLSELFKDSRDYDIRQMVKDYLNMDYDYSDHYWECMDVDSWLIDRIDNQNMEIIRSKYLEDLEGEENEDDFLEFIEEEYGSDIGCAASDAQHSADIDSLHSDFVNGIEDYLSNFNGKLQNVVDNEGNKGFGLEYVGEVEIGDLMQSPYGYDELYSMIDDYMEGEGWKDLFYRIYREEVQYGYSSEHNYFFPEDGISINTDKHFRYGGSGDVDWNYFNEILSDKLSWH